MFLAIGLPAWAADVIKIGVIGPMNFVQGQGHWNGASMAAEEINAAGGVQVGKKKMMIELVKADITLGEVTGINSLVGMALAH